ncbi:hypothetical protein [Gallaecimonas xiamenensis]|uniref:Uncharacterized protein n=1 Tax=Gallaecimonas xiamenensis 3-C-1 TaxID=745411 RepID=K2KD89_9GAMM|nr:hypothetical protein [Gallaecimonas xiamenensis]EKE75245.1 hypothetical protein B3C1_08211 [Gallaecimonas xiamenensis 3-C-1]
MRTINTAILKLAKRAETYDKQHLIDSFVDVGPLLTLLSNQDSQILFGRRGTGKTHVLSYLANERAAAGETAIQIDMRTIGSTGGIFSDSSLTVSERATRLLVDTLCTVHDQLLTIILDQTEEFDLSVLGPLLDGFVDAATEVTVKGKVVVEESSGITTRENSTRSIEAGASADSLSIRAGTSTDASREIAGQRKATREGEERLRVHFGAVGTQLRRVVEKLPKNRLWLILDEWSEIPLDLQPFLADLLRRTVLPIGGISVKIAAIEQRCRFRVPDSELSYIGIEIGADAAASVHLDEFLVFENNQTLAKDFFRELLFKHLKAIDGGDSQGVFSSTSSGLVNEIFTQKNAFEEFVRSAEGVPRDAINILGVAAQKAGNNQISVPDVRVAGRIWYTRAKQHAVSSKPGAQELLSWIIDKVIGHRSAKAFLLPTDAQDEVIDFLYDSRVLHIIKQGVSAQDVPGIRFNVFALDYGCYVDLVNTARAPKGLFEIDTEDGARFVEVPQTDFRSIRRSILDLKDFYAESAAR